MAAALRPLRLPGFPSLGARLLRQRARQLARRDRARGARLRQPPAARWRPRRCSSACTSRPRCSARRSSPGSSSSRPGVDAAGALRGRGGRVRASWRCSSTELRARRRARARDPRRLDRLGRAGADPGLGRRGARARGPAARGQRAAQRRLHRRRRRRAGDRRARGRGRRASRPRCSPTPSRSSRSPRCSRSAAGSRAPRPRRPRAAGRRGCGAGSPTCASARRCGACSAPRRRRSSSSRS